MNYAADIGGSNLDRSVMDILKREKSRALSPREWRFRLEGYGLRIKEIGDTQVVTQLPLGNELGVLPAQFA